MHAAYFIGYAIALSGLQDRVLGPDGVLHKAMQLDPIVAIYLVMHTGLRSSALEYFVSMQKPEFGNTEQC